MLSQLKEPDELWNHFSCKIFDRLQTPHHLGPLKVSIDPQEPAPPIDLDSMASELEVPDTGDRIFVNTDRL